MDDKEELYKALKARRASLDTCEKRTRFKLDNLETMPSTIKICQHCINKEE